MLLENDTPVENRCPHWWTAGAAGALVGLAVCGAGVGLAQAPPNQREVLEQLERIQDLVNKLRTQVAQPGAVNQEGKDVNRTLTILLEDTKNPADRKKVEQAIELVLGLQAGQIDAAQREAAKQKAALEDQALRVRKSQQEADAHLREVQDLLAKYKALVEEKAHEKAQAQLHEAIKKLQAIGASAQVGARRIIVEPAGKEGSDFFRVLVQPPPPPLPPVAAWIGESRPVLGIRPEVPSDLLADQLNLAKGKGLVVAEVIPGTVAAKAGLKVNDILLKIKGMEVTSDPAALVRLLAEIKTDTAFEIQILRRGKLETIADVKLPPPPVQPRVVAAKVRLWDVAGQGAQLLITVHKTGKELTIRRQEGPLSIVVKAEPEGGKNKIKSITIDEKGKSETFFKVDDVPANHRDKVQQLILLLGSVDVSALLDDGELNVRATAVRALNAVPPLPPPTPLPQNDLELGVIEPRALPVLPPVAPTPR